MSQLDHPDRGAIKTIATREAEDLSRFLARKAEADEMRRHADVLTARQRVIFDLRWHDGLSAVEIARRLDRSLGAVMESLGRIRRRLLRAMETGWQPRRRQVRQVENGGNQKARRMVPRGRIVSAPK